MESRINVDPDPNLKHPPPLLAQSVVWILSYQPVLRIRIPELFYPWCGIGDGKKSKTRILFLRTCFWFLGFKKILFFAPYPGSRMEKIGSGNLDLETSRIRNTDPSNKNQRNKMSKEFRFFYYPTKVADLDGCLILLRHLSCWIRIQVLNPNCGSGSSPSTE
jgi:hypothetical protein